MIIDWGKGDISLHSLSLEHLMRRVKNLIYEFHHVSFKHICIEYNEGADEIWNKSIGIMDDNIFKLKNPEMEVS